MNIVFIGCVDFSARCLESLIRLNAKIVGVCTLETSLANADHVDLTPIAEQNSIPICYATDINSAQTIAWIRELAPDVIFCLGWSRLIKEEVLQIPPMGVVGFHPAALPKNRGRHPIIWSLVLGLDETASTFFIMDEGADSGDILSQRPVNIMLDDNASSLYTRVTGTAIAQIEEFLPRLIARTYYLYPQDHSLANNWRKRGAHDGQVDWRMSAKSIYNLVRGLSHPYVGAHFMHRGAEIKVWECKIVTGTPDHIEPGKILRLGESGPIIKTGEGAVELISFHPKVTLNVKEYL